MNEQTPSAIPTTPQTPPASPPPVNKTHNRLPLIAAGIIVLLVIASVSYMVLSQKPKSSEAPQTKLVPSVEPTPTAILTTIPQATALSSTQPVAQMKTYTAEAMGISFSYPASWTVETKTTSVNTSFIRVLSPANTAGQRVCVDYIVDTSCTTQDTCVSGQLSEPSADLVGTTSQGYKETIQEISPGGKFISVDLYDTYNEIFTPHKQGLRASATFFCDANPTAMSNKPFSMSLNQQRADTYFSEGAAILKSTVLK